MAIQPGLCCTWSKTPKTGVLITRLICHMSPAVRKPTFCICENKDADQLAVTAQLISAFDFIIQKVQSLFFLNPKFQASSHLLWLYSPVCVGPGRKPQRQVFSQRGSYYTFQLMLTQMTATAIPVCTEGRASTAFTTIPASVSDSTMVQTARTI